jgi:hypothetical protein
VIEEIQDKTIHLVKKEDQHVFFPDLPELIEAKDEVDEIKKIKVSEGIDMKNAVKPSNMKSIVIDPTYVADDS